MKINLQASFEVNSNLNDLIEKKVEKLGTYSSTVREIDVFLKTGENRHRRAEAQIVELKVPVPGQILFAEAKADSFEKALASATEKMRRQIRKFNQQITDHTP